MLISVDDFVVRKICNEMLFNQLLHDSANNGGVFDRTVIGLVKSCVFLVYGDHDRRLLLGR